MLTVIHILQIPANSCLAGKLTSDKSLAPYAGSTGPVSSSWPIAT